jgi:hypothetical protein
MRYDALHIVLPQCRFLYCVSKAICKQLPPLQFLCGNIASCVETTSSKMSDISDSENEVDILEETLNVGCVTNKEFLKLTTSTCN